MNIKNIFGVGLNIGKGQNGYLTSVADKKLVVDDLKQIIFTNPGERVNEPSFGVGIERFLFEPNSLVTKQQIEFLLREQISAFLPIVNLIGIDFEATDNELKIVIKYMIEDYSNAIDTLTIKRDIVGQ